MIKMSLRLRLLLMALPLAIVLGVLLLATIYPYFGVTRDIHDLERRLASTLPISHLAESVSQQSREYGDILITGSGHEEGEVREAAAAARRHLQAWRSLAVKDGSGDLETINGIERTHAQLTALGETAIQHAREGRTDEAAAILTGPIESLHKSLSGPLDQRLLRHRQEMANAVARISRGGEYLWLLRLGGLQEGVADLDSHVNEVLESATFKRELERELSGYGSFYLSRGARSGAEIDASHQRAIAAYAAWHNAVENYGGTKHFGGPKQQEELKFLDRVDHEYKILHAHGQEVIRHTTRGSSVEARGILIKSLEFDDLELSETLRKYVDHETEVVGGNLEYLAGETRRLRIVFLLIGAVAFILLSVPALLSRGLIQPILTMKSAARRIGQGDLDIEVAVPDIAELASLANSFNEMAGQLKRSRESLERSEERFQLAAKATSDMIWDADLVSRIVWRSEGFQARFGLDGQDGAERDWIQAVHPDDVERIGASVEEAILGTGQLWSNEYRLRLIDDTYANVFDKAYILRDSDGVAIRMIGATLDITERRTAEQAVASLSRQNEMILNSVGDGIVGLDRDGSITSVSPAAAVMLGSKAEELLGRKMRELVRIGKAKGTDESLICRTLNEGMLQTSDQEQFTRSDGSAFFTDYTSSPMHDETGTVIGAVVAFRDITHRHEVELLKAQFVSTVSHELRTPLTSIRGALGLLGGGLLGSVSPKGQRMLDLAVSNTDRLVRLINDILDIEKLDSGAITLTRSRVNVAELMQQAVDVMKPMADNAGVTMHLTPATATISADQDRIMQTLTNLLSNAIKFSPRDTTIHLGAGADNRMLRFEVRDSGRGIPPGKIKTIFERFQQVDASDSRDKGGTGLGLPICRSIIQQHGGKIWAESVLGQGSTFFFTVPLDEAETSPILLRDQAVLVCDDDPSIREILTELLQSHGYAVITSDNGPAAIELARRYHPRAILLDLLMDGMNGWEVMAALKEHEYTRDIPILVASVTSAGEAGRLAESHADQIAGWVAKPLQESALFELLERVTGRTSSAPRILIIEDDHEFAAILTMLFEQHGVSVFHAADGAHAIELASTVRPDLLILDVGLPDMNGFNVVKWLKKDDLLRRIPVIVYSGSDIPAEQRYRLELGHTEFFTKSRISPQQFGQTVMGLLHAIVEHDTKNESEVEYVQASAAH